MRIKAAATLFLLTLTSVWGQTITLEVSPEKKIEDAVKEAVVKLVNSDSALAQKYTESMDLAFDFLDPEDPRRISAADISNLGDYSLNTWIPSHSFRYGQGDYEFCNGEEEIASYDMGTVIVGFDTSYKREETYGFWAVYSYSYDWCEADSFDSADPESETGTKARIRLEHMKWVSSEAVSQLLY